MPTKARASGPFFFVQPRRRPGLERLPGDDVRAAPAARSLPA